MLATFSRGSWWIKKLSHSISTSRFALPYFAFFYFLPVFLFTPIVLFPLSLSLDLCTSFIPRLAINTDALAPFPSLKFTPVCAVYKSHGEYSQSVGQSDNCRFHEFVSKCFV